MNPPLILAAVALSLLAGCAGYGHRAHHPQGGMPMPQDDTMMQGGGMHGGMMMMAPARFHGGMLMAHGGRTLYRFDRDQAGSSACNGDCAMKWPPYLAPAGASASGDFGLVQRSDGSQQWTHRGRPLYFWSGDQSPGDTLGDNIGGVWHVVRP
ncbi:hypothetical protein ACFSQE_12420 [Vogesella fluminis]|uniref:Lipoprotein with Yx(FWY)xxD motif n=1 Tax=Vogesella fluminis TaxID=1069161 RepID=A0ABQ3H9U6_9NEIS|nr:hypothetical protein [Vogesella fluminis]GHD74262.1 hypothetical protein GCM10011419_10250 [Vogesella fluminis]